MHIAQIISKLHLTCCGFNSTDIPYKIICIVAATDLKGVEGTGGYPKGAHRVTDSYFTLENC
jgi:hypothetical protein